MSITTTMTKYSNNAKCTSKCHYTQRIPIFLLISTLVVVGLLTAYATFIGILKISITMGGITMHNTESLLSSPSSSTSIEAKPDSIYIPGTGFSGIWYVMGLLHSVPNLSSKPIYCYSSGCIAAVTALRNQSIEEFMNRAEEIQLDYKAGRMNRYEIAEEFFDSFLLDETSIGDNQNINHINNNNKDEAFFASNLHIITSVYNDKWGLESVVTVPKNMKELKDLLLQTSWVPLATGNTLAYKGHLDGGFTTYQHPPCEHYVEIPFRHEIFMNTFNINLSKATATKLWNYGFEQDLDW